MPLLGLSNLRKAIDKMQDNINDDIRGVYLAGLQNIVQNTPARKGVARNNWNLTDVKPSNKFSKSASIGGSSSINSIMSSMPNNILGKRLFFTNNTPYINTLEYGGYPNPVEQGSWFEGRFQKLSSGGYSKQAPAGMARINLIKMRKKIKALK